MIPMQNIDIILILVWAAYFTYWFLSAWKDRSPLKRISGTMPAGIMRLMLPVEIGGVLLVTFAPEVVTGRFLPGEAPYVIAGTVITLCGLAFAIWARLHLGKSWTGLPAIRKDHCMVRTGPYSTVRNPIYTGILVALAGTAVATGYTAVVLIFLAALCVFIGKIRMEERLLEEEFGEDYVRYKREVKTLVPFVL
jgi:protein-S-isoprenylcysteine O-methyltransferase Ste14